MIIRMVQVGLQMISNCPIDDLIVREESFTLKWKAEVWIRKDIKETWRNRTRFSSYRKHLLSTSVSHRFSLFYSYFFFAFIAFKTALDWWWKCKVQPKYIADILCLFLYFPNKQWLKRKNSGDYIWCRWITSFTGYEILLLRCFGFDFQQGLVCS